MKVKLDENLGRLVLEVFLAAGHDAVSISQQALTGAPDARVFDVCHPKGVFWSLWTMTSAISFVFQSRSPREQ